MMDDGAELEAATPAPSDGTSPSTGSPDERLRRWRLILGGAAADSIGVSLDGADIARDIDEAAAPQDVHVGLDESRRLAQPVDDHAPRPDFVLLVPVLTPFVQVPQHIEQSQVVGQ